MTSRSARLRESPGARIVRVVAVLGGAPLFIAALLSSDAFIHRPQRAAARTVWDSVYSVAQAARGESSYVKTCARCHQASLGGADESPALTGAAFLGNWNGQSLHDLHERIRTSMPTDDPGTYARPMVTDVIAYILKVNGFPAGAADLPATSDSLKDIVVQATKP